MGKHIVFGNLEGVENQHQYVTNKLRQFGNSSNVVESVVGKVVENHSPLELSLVAGRSVDELANQENVQKLAKCFLELAENWFQLEEGEQMLEETFSCLETSVDDYPAGSPVIMKKTNLATTYYIDTNFKVDGNRLIAQPRYVRSLVLTAAAEDSQKSIMEDFASELVDAALGEIGSTVLGLIIGDDGEPSLKELEEGFTNIIKKELIKFDVTNENAKLQTQYQNVNQMYNVKKREGAGKAELFGDVEDIEEKVRDSVNNLGSKPYSEMGLPGYIAGRNLQFCMLPGKMRPRSIGLLPLESQYEQVLVNNINDAIDHVQTNYDNALKNRFDQISTGEYDIPKRTGIETHWRVFDNFNNTVVFDTLYGGSANEVKKEKHDANVAREAYENGIRATLQWMLNVKTKWQELVNHPLGRDSN